MSVRARYLSVAAVAALLVVAFVLWFTSEGQRLHRLLNDVRDERGVVRSVVVNDEGISEVRFTDRASAEEILSVWERLEEVGVDRVQIGEVDVDPYDMKVATAVAASVAEVRVPPASLAVREVGEREIWLEAGFPQRLEGVADPQPADGAAVVLTILEALEPGDLPDGLYLVAAHRLTKQLDLVLVERSALFHLDATIASLRRVAATDPEHRIVCDADGCRAD